MNRLVELNNLTRREADAVLDRVIDLDAQIFRSPNEETRARFEAGMRNLSAGDKVVVFYEEAGKTVGYSMITIQRLEVDGRVAWVVGSAAGFLPGHTGGNRTMIDAIHAMLRHKVGHPSRQYFMVSYLVTPSGYGMLASLCPETFPSLHRPGGDCFEARLISTLAKKRALPVLIDEPGRVVTAGRIAVVPFERRRSNEHIRFYEELNPGYVRGELLGVCVPLGVEQLLGGAARLVERRVRKSLGLKR